MKIVGKVVSVLVMVISAVLLLAFLAGITGVWWGQGQLKVAVTGVSATMDNALERTQTALGMINGVVSNTQERVNQASANVANAGTKIEETNLALVAAEKLLDQDLAPTVDRVTEQVSYARDMISVIDRTVGLMLFLPGAQDNKLLVLADTVIEKIKALGQAVQDIRTTINDTKSQVTAEAVGKLTEPLNRASEALGTVSSDLAAMGQAVDARQVQLATLTKNVLTGITLAAVVLTLALLWLAMAQLGLFLHALGAFTGRDPLPAWHRGKASSEASPVVQPTGGAA